MVNKAVLNPERTPVAGPTPLCHKGAPHHLVANPPDAKVTAGITEVGAASIGLLLTRRVRGILQQIEPQLLVYAFGITVFTLRVNLFGSAPEVDVADTANVHYHRVLVRSARGPAQTGSLRVFNFHYVNIPPPTRCTEP